MKRYHIFALTVLALTLLSACKRQQAGLETYHEALALMERGDAPAALKKLEQAGEQAQTDSLRALVESQKGTLYFAQRLLDRSLQSYQNAYEIDKRACDTIGLIYDLRDIGNVFRATAGREDSCLAYFQQAQTLAIATQNLPMQRDVESQMAGFYLYRNQLDKARELLIPALQHIDSTNQSGLLFMMADLYQRSGQRDSAAYFYRQLLQHGTIYTRQAAHRALADYALADGKTDEALAHVQMYEQLSDSVHKENDAEALRRMSALYDYSLSERQAAKLRTQLIVAIATVLLLALLLLSVVLYYSRRRMHYQLKVEKLEHLLEKSNAMMSEKRPPSPTNEETKKKFPVFQKMERLLNETQQQALGDDDFHDLEEAVDSLHPDFLRQLQEFCRLSPQERRVCLLVKTNMPPAAIAQLTAHTKQSITNTRSRLYKKAFGRAGSPAEWDEFIRSL